MVDASCGGAFLQKSAEEGWALFETLNENSIQRASTARNGLGTQATVKSNGVFEVRQSPDLSQKVEKLTQTLENIFCTGTSSTTRPTIGEVCALCLSPAHPVTDCHLAPHYPDWKQPDQGNFAQGPKPNFPIGQIPPAYRPNIPPGYQQPTPLPPQRNTDFEEKVLRALQNFEVTNQTTSQLLSSHTQSIAKLETQMGQLANALSRRDEGKLPSQSVANPKGQYEVHDIHGHEQAKAIMTLRAGREIDTRPEDEKNDKKEEEKSSNNSKAVVSESPPPKGDVTLPPTCAKELPTAPRVLRAPFPACLTSPSSFDKKASQYPPIEEADCCAITMMDELVEEALPYILTEDPLEACLTHFGFDEYDIDHSIEDVNALLGETTPFIDRHPWCIGDIITLFGRNFVKQHQQQHQRLISQQIYTYGGLFWDDADGSDNFRPIAGHGTSTVVVGASPAAYPPPSSMGKPAQTDRKSKKGTLMQIQSDTISAAKAALNPVRTNIMPQKQKKKPVSYAQLARSIHELAATSDQKSSQKQLVHHVFPKLAVYNSVDPSLAPSLVMLGQQFLGGGIPTPNWDALADIDAVGGVTRADVVPRIVERLSSEATNDDVEFHARRLQALKALTYAPSSSSEILSRLYEIVFGLLDKVADEPQKRKKGIFGTKGGDKEFIIRSNLQYAALSALRRLPLDPGNPAFLHRAVQGEVQISLDMDTLSLEWEKDEVLESSMVW
ncbi:SH3 domain-containing protein [Actinidia rufa]|uniref:SH3 domain-containing protein n=1 Tax=Actinidia rufa TaxID=165716 RepID=A0A7J0DWW9_9ERIC|nr:SH3 domain-containing protein [Actinidia rufa]